MRELPFRVLNSIAKMHVVRPALEHSPTLIDKQLPR